MIGLVLVTHGRLADEFRAALEHVMGPQKQIEAVTIGAEDDSDLCRNDIIEAVNRVDSGDGVAILTDMFGGTPSNLAISCMSRPKVEVLAGINLPMLVKLAKVREERSLPDAIAMAQTLGIPNTYLIHMGHTVDYQSESEKLPHGVQFCYDGMEIRF